MNLILISLTIIVSFLIIYVIVAKRRKGTVKEQNTFYLVLHPDIRLQVLNVARLNIDSTISSDIEKSYCYLNEVDEVLATNYRDLMYLQLHLDNGKNIAYFDISEELYKELIREVDYFFMARMVAPSPNDDKAYYLPSSLEEEMIGYH